MSGTRKVSGSFIGQDQDGGVAVKLELRTSDSGGSAVDIAPMVGAGGRTIASSDRKVSHHMHQISLALAAETYARRRITPIAKPAGPRKRPKTFKAAICPDCLGERSFDCDRCEGAGQIPE